MIRSEWEEFRLPTVEFHSSANSLSGAGLHAGGFEVAEKFAGGVVGEAKIGARECLVEQRHAYEIDERAPFGGIARRGDDVRASGEHCAGNLAVEWGKECELAFNQREIDRAAAQGEIADRENVLGVGPHVR